MKTVDFRKDPNSESIVNSICNLISLYEYRHKKKCDDEKLKEINNLQQQDIYRALPYLEDTVRFINLDLNKLYVQSEKDDFYFFDCSFDLYQKLLSDRLNKFLSDHKNSKELEFFENELEKLKTPNKQRFFSQDFSKINYSKYLLDNIDFKIALRRKLEFIKHELADLKGGLKYKSKIFRNSLAEGWFNNTLDELNALDENKKGVNSFQAKSAAIFYDKKCKDLIFKYDLQLKIFIAFLNKSYNAEIKHLDKLSDGKKHITEVSKLIKLYQTEWLANNSE